MADPGMEKLLRRAKEMQEEQSRRLAGTVVEATTADGRVTATMNGHRALLAIEIDPDLVAPENQASLESLVAEVVNDATTQIDEILAKRFGIVDKMPSLSIDNIFGKRS